MTFHETNAKSILIKRKRVDSWFVSRYGMNLYRGCEHNCAYCDGRSESYRVDGEFGEHVEVKVNAPDLLEKELKAQDRKQTALSKANRGKKRRGFYLMGGGVGDSYQPAEQSYGLTRKALYLMHEHGLPVHILTKSTLVVRDFDLIKRISQLNGAVVSFSMSSADEISTLFEPGVPSPAERLNAIRTFHDGGIRCGMFLMPVIPFVTDTPEIIERAIWKARDAGVDFVIFGGMTLKDGRQKDHFFRTLRERFPELVKQYKLIYPGNKWGAATREYYRLINRRFFGIAKKHHVPTRIPPSIYKDILGINDLVAVTLEQLDYHNEMEGKPARFTKAIEFIWKLQKPLNEVLDLEDMLEDLGSEVSSLIMEIVQTRSCRMLEQMLT